MHNTEFDDIDRLFARLDRAPVPDDLTARVLSSTVSRTTATRAVLAWPWMIACIVALGVLAMAGYELGVSLAASDGLDLLTAILGDVGLLTTAPGDVLAALGEVVPWTLVAAAGLSALLLILAAGNVVSRTPSALRNLAAAVGATGVFVAAAAVGASQTRQQPVSPPVSVVARPTRTAQPKPTVGPAAPTAVKAVRPERSLAGTIRDLQPDAIVIVGVGGRTWRVEPVPGALIRLNGKAARLDALQPGDSVVILGQAQGGPGQRFLAHAITAKSH